jgi:tetratricopeptide (TPR) repeat protein
LPERRYRLGRWLAVALVALLPWTSQADQNDPRLDGLFAILKSDGNPQAVQAAEAEIWRIWLESGHEDIDALMRAGIIAMTNLRLDDAIGIFSEITKRAPDFAEGWNKRATAYYLDEDYVASVRDIQRTLALEPRHFGAISGMGLIFLARGDTEGALAAFEAVIAIHPQAPGARERVEELRQRVLEHGA